MYSRSYPNPGQGLIPPNYSGNAFDLARERRKGPPSDEKSDQPKLSDSRAENSGHQRSEHAEKSLPCGRTNPFGSLLFRRDGKKIESDDILLAGLIILLLTSGADEELILILGFLFIAGL